ncbi:DNA cytosine methyltransferase [Bowmanella yangjiangensis]|uniref:DNA cytosine methyltransferase n=1 Tax=Bowmanella yangjiangensis TaxID=2811230 RepID=UPI0022B81B10|nr:DNA cytosine methyltransferase [Bowmanella yangjiangensis]
MIGIDLFAGAGGMSLGARLAGVDVQVVVEADKHAAATYARNHVPSVGMFDDDIRNFQKIELVNQRNEPVVVFGGPPCQGFSTSNQRTRSSDNQNNWLFKEFLRVVEMYMPDWVVFENVKGILETEGGIFAEQMITSLSELGYSCESEVLNAINFGVPQKRDRFFIVGNLHGQRFKFPEGCTNSTVTVRDALEDLPALENGSSECFKHYKKIRKPSQYSQMMRGGLDGCNNNLVTRNAPFIIERYKHIPQGGNWESIPVELMANYKDRSRCHTGIYRRLCENSPSVVIGNYRKNMLIHPHQDRGLSVREAARLQSFPDSFVFEGSIGFQQQQVGNAVPPLLAKAIFESIVSYHLGTQ